MIAVDTNILVYANRLDSRWHAQAWELVEQLAKSGSTWGIPWPCVTEFFAVMTRGDRDGVHMDSETAVAAINDLVDVAGAVVLVDRAGCWQTVQALLKQTDHMGSEIYDLRILAVCQQHGVSELLTVDAKLTAIDAGIKLSNPFIEPLTPEIVRETLERERR